MSRDINIMKTSLEESLSQLKNPLPIQITISIEEKGILVLLKVNLPLIEDMPKQISSYSFNSKYKISIKILNQTQLFQLYTEYVYGLFFTIIGYVFHELPKVENVVISGFSQITNNKTGEIENSCISIIKVKREKWEDINFENLNDLNIIEYFDNFEILRKISKKHLQ